MSNFTVQIAGSESLGSIVVNSFESKEEAVQFISQNKAEIEKKYDLTPSENLDFSPSQDEERTNIVELEIFCDDDEDNPVWESYGTYWIKF